MAVKKLSKQALEDKIKGNTQTISERIDKTESNLGTYRIIPVEKIKYNPQNRRKYTHNQVRECADSIKQIGLQQNIVVLQEKDGYMLLAGEKRTRAHRLLTEDGNPGFDNIYALIYQNLDEVKQEIIQLQTNQLSTVDNLEEREAVAQRITELVDGLKEKGYKGSKRKIIEDVTGISGKTIEKDMKLSKLIPELKQLMETKGLAQSGMMHFGDLNKEKQLIVYDVLKTLTDEGNKVTSEQMKTMSKQHKEEIEKLETENSTLIKKNKLLEDELLKKTRQSSDLKKQLTEQDNDIETMRQHLENAQNAGNVKEVERLTSLLDNAKKERQIQCNIIENKTREIEELQTKLNNKENKENNPLPGVQQNIELGFMIDSIEKRFNEMLRKYLQIEDVNDLNQDKLMQLSEKILNAVQRVDVK